MKASGRNALGATFAVVFGLASTLVAATEKDPMPGQWEWGAQIYLWGAGIGGTTVGGDDVDISFNDLISHLDFAFMGTLAARRDKFMLFADLIYLNVSDGETTTANLIGFPVEAKIDVGMKGFISTLGGAYRVVETDSAELNALAGARYRALDTDLDIQIPAIGVNQSYSDSGSVWDGVVGVRGNVDLSGKWYLSYYADVGTGNSKMTWQALGAVNYRFSKVDAVLGYRYLAWEFDDDDTFDDLNISGPYAGVKFRF